MTAAEVLIIKQQRRNLLTNLNLLYPHPMQVQTVYRTVNGYDPNYDPSNYKRDIMYFHDKGWLRFADDTLGGAVTFEEKVIILTAKGKEIAEQTMTDPALEI